MRKPILALQMAALGLLFSLALTSHAQGIYKLTSVAAERAALEFRQSIETQGLTMTRLDLRAVDLLLKQREAVAALRLKAAEAHRLAAAAALKEESVILLAERRSLDSLGKSLPQVPASDQLKARLPLLGREAQQYFVKKAKGDERRIGRSDHLIRKMVQRIKGSRQTERASSALLTASRNSIAALVSRSGPLPDRHGSMEIWVNGQVVDRARQVIDVKAGQPLVIRVVGIDSRRSMIRGFRETAVTELLKPKNDYGISYRSKSGLLVGTSSFAVASEVYEWSTKAFGDKGAQCSFSDSGIHAGLKRDQAVVTCRGPVEIEFSVRMKIHWTINAVQPGGRKTGIQAGHARTTFAVKVVPD